MNAEYMFYSSIEEMEKALGISSDKAYELANHEDFPSIRIGKRIFIPVDALHRWLKS